MMNLIDKYNDVIVECGIALFGIMVLGCMWIMCIGFIPMYGYTMTVMACIITIILIVIIVVEFNRIEEAIKEAREH